MVISNGIAVSVNFGFKYGLGPILVARTTNFCAVAPNICGPSGWNVLHITLLAPRILRSTLGSCKIVHTCPWRCVTKLQKHCTGLCHPRCVFKLYGEVNSVKNTTINIWLNDGVY